MTEAVSKEDLIRALDGAKYDKSVVLDMIDKHPEMVKTLTEAKDKDGKTLFSAADVNDILFGCKDIIESNPDKITAVLDNPEEVKLVLFSNNKGAGIRSAVKEPLESTVAMHPEAFPRESVVSDMTDKHPEMVKTLTEAKDKEGKPLFSATDVNDVLFLCQETIEKHPERITAVLGNPEEVENIAFWNDKGIHMRDAVNNPKESTIAMYPEAFAHETETTPTAETKKKLSEYGMDLDANIVEQLGFSADKELTQSEFEAFKKKYQELKQPSEKQSDEPAPKPTAEQEDSEKPAEEKVEEAKEQEEKSEEPAEKQEEVDLVPPESNDDEIGVNEDWVAHYNRIMTNYAKDHDQEWKRELQDENGNDIEGLKGKMGEAEIHFTARDKAKANLAGIEALVNLAKETGQEIAYNEKWSDEFKQKMFAVCDDMGINIQGRPAQLENKEEEKLALPEPEKPVENEAEKEAEKEPKPEHKYKITPRFADANLTMYALKVRTNKNFETEVSKQEQQLASGFYAVSETNEDKVKAEVLMKKYAIAMHKNDKETAENCATALQRYGAERIDRIPDQAEGKYKVVEGKPYAERTDEEKARIDQAMAKALPSLNKTEEKGKDNTKAPMPQKQNAYE